MHVWDLTVSKGGQILPNGVPADQQECPGNELLVSVTKDNHQVYYQALQVKLPSSYGGQEFHQVVTEKESLLVDPRSGQITLSFPPPLVALRVQGRFIASYAIRGVYLSEVFSFPEM